MLTIIRHCVTILMLQDKHIVLQRDEVQVLIVNFMNVGNTA